MKIRNMGLYALMILQSGCSLVGIQKEEGPKYNVLIKEGNKEIRLYESYIVAKTSVKGTYKQAQSKAFKKLAGYIFGKNTQKLSISMTSPVVQDQSKTSQTISMTSPVTQSKKGDVWTLSFMMPSQYSLNDLPTPNEPGIEFETIPEKYVAAIAFTWNTDEKRNQINAEELLLWINKQNNFTAASTPKYAGYNPPWTIPFFRRNEMLIDVNKMDADTKNINK